MLTFPLIAAVASAGVLGGIHCAGMCGGMATMLSSVAKRGHRIIPIVPAHAAASSAGAVNGWRTSALLHAGRIFTYGLMGAVVGLLGGAGLMLKPIMPVHTILFVIGNLALIWLGVRLAGYAPLHAPLARLGSRLAAGLPPQFSLATHTRRHPFIAGMAWGCLPCGLLYGVLPFALLSGAPWSGAALMVIFGLTTLPYLLLAQGTAQWLRHRRVPFILKGAGALALVSFGLYGLWHVNAAQLPSFLCITPVH